MSQLPHMHEPCLLPNYKLDFVCILEFPVPELHERLAVEVTQPSADIGVVAETCELALLVSNLQKASFRTCHHSMICNATSKIQIKSSRVCILGVPRNMAISTDYYWPN